MARPPGSRTLTAGEGPFQLLCAGSVRLLVRAEAAPRVKAMLEAHGTLHDAARAEPDAMRLHGRRPVFSIPAALPRHRVRADDGAGDPDDARWVVRHSFRGGAVASLLGDRYFRLGRPRPFLEAEASETLRTLGFRTPRVIAAVVYTSGIIRRGDVVTEHVPDARELAAILFGGERGAEGIGASAALRAAGGLVRALGRAGAYHPDLNAKNILLQPAQGGGGASARAGPEAWLIDLDRCRTSLPPRRRPSAAERMHRRLRRSIRKWEAATGVRLGEAEWRALDGAFEGRGSGVSGVGDAALPEEGDTTPPGEGNTAVPGEGDAAAT